LSLLSEQAREIFAAAMRAVDVRAVVRSNVQPGSGTLRLGTATMELADVDRVLIVAIGKAAVPMYEAAAESLRSVAGISVEAIVVSPEPKASSASVLFLAGTHPTPDHHSRRAAETVLARLNAVTPRTTVLFLISGGASAMMELPLDPRISIEDIAAFHRVLVGSGLPIEAMNTLRKHASAVKGGRLALAAAAAHAQVTLLVSDVPAGAADAIGSGPSLPDTTTLEDCETILQRVRRTAELPRSIEAFFGSELCGETPKAHDGAFECASWSVILSGEHLSRAAADAALAAGFHVEIDNLCDEGEYRETALALLDRAAELAREHARSCLVSVGEVSVALSSTPGEGGRNQQFALWCAAELARRGQRATVLSGGTDGIDGHSIAAGAVCDEETVSRGTTLGLSVEDALAGFNTSPLLHALGADIVIGPTGNNLRDLRLILSER
jgi:glycerate 2-kinase